MKTDGAVTEKKPVYSEAARWDDAFCSSTTCDEYGLPFEALDEYSDAPLEFEEITRTLWEDLNDTYILAVRTNRLSPGYQILCAHLEKNIKLLGSLCVTGAVLEQKGMTFPSLGGLSVKELYAMVSLHFRKCDRAFREIRDAGEGLDMSLLDWMGRWGNLLERLKATEEKIRNIRSGKISVDTMLERTEIFSGEPRGTQVKRDPRRIARAASLPVIGSYARDLAEQRRQEELAEKREAARKERERRAWQKKMNAQLPGAARPFKPAPVFYPGSDSLCSDMIRDAQARGDRETLKRIMGDFPADYFGVPEQEEDPPMREGPSDEKRKKLREQRKKRKK